MIIAGEASGDLHGASLINQLKNVNSTIKFYGIGGDKMIAEGLTADFNIKDMAFLGFTEIIKHIPFIKKVQKTLLNRIEKESISVAVLIDYPGFNLSIAKKMKELGVKIIYYISPQVWAWGKKRILKIKKLVNKMLVIFPFEKEIYEKAGISVDFVGHPLIERIADYNFLSKEKLYAKFSLDREKEILLIMPGSRIQEIKKIFPECIKAASRLSEKFHLQTVVACSNNINENIFQFLTENKNFHIIKDLNYDLMKYAKFGIIKSGTSTLEAGLFKLPSIVVYATSWTTYIIGKSLIRIKNIAMANILAGETIFPELIQKDVNSETIFQNANVI